MSQALSGDPNIALTIAGRDHAKAQTFARKVADAKGGEVATLGLDANDTAQLREALRSNKPDLVIHTCGPYQGQGQVSSPFLHLFFVPFLVFC